MNPQIQDVEKVVKEITEVGADVVIDCVGSLFNQCMNLVWHGGQILLVGMKEHALLKN